jgi:predicted 3-demethylubiquinone-9 3-methyltransferase (glyoxalase superfamily)
MSKVQKITPFFWFDGNAEEAANFYVSIFPDARIINVSRWGEGGPVPAGTALGVEFELAGQKFRALNGGPQYKFSPATSMFISCEDQAEVDHYWDKLLEGGKASQCGWLDDKFGLTWQVVPTALPRLLGHPDKAVAGRVMQAMMGMVKLDVAGLEAAARG